MKRSISIPEARALIRTRAQLEDDGWRDSDVRRAVAADELRRLQRNRYVASRDWKNVWAESQHLLEVVAVAEEMRGGPAVVSHESAAVVHRLPLYRFSPPAVQTTVAGATRMSGTARVVRHNDALPEADITVVHGIVCTTLERTAFDIARTRSWEMSVAFADAAMRRATVHDRVLDADAAEHWRERMNDRVGQSAGQRGIRQAARVASFADGRAELPGESVSRVQLARLGFTDLRLQVPIPSPDGGEYQVDIAIATERAFWEFDGKGKYLDVVKRSGKSLEQVLLDEKRREDWIRGTTQWRLARGEDAHIATAEALGRRLAAFGIRPPL